MDFKEKVKRNVADNFDQSIRIYQEFEEKHGFFSSYALALAETIGLTQKSSVLDVGCGYGLSAAVLSRHYGCRVLGIDLSLEMIAAGRAMEKNEDIRLVVGDGENLSPIVGDEQFDYVVYNASIFIFPDAAKAIDQAFRCLCPGGKIAFSYYPQLVGDNESDLFDTAFKRLGEPLPRFRVITDYADACKALADCCGNIRHHRRTQPLDIGFLQDFFSIPAQSASLFPGRSYEERQELVRQLFAGLHDAEDRGQIVWCMAEGSKKTPTASCQCP
ncbi:MAG: class I SAM-dependent methyltransferase [Desulfococcaceae bacterium]|nr:class I SAM-dependent methyltransferase [Desulfococcaceae bacterium]